MIEDKKEGLEVLEQAEEEGDYKPVRPLPLPPKKKKKKKKPFPSDPDDPESDEDFDDEEDDDDDETGSDTDTEPDTEDENELRQEEQKPQSFFQNPFFLFKRHENMALKKGPHPEKQQRSPIQKFFDVLLYGVEGARIKNGELPKQNISDELLLGLGFKAFLKDVLLGRQAAKYWKQKMGGKENASLLKVGIKGLKKQAMNDPAARVMTKELQSDLKAKSQSELKQQQDILQQLKVKEGVAQQQIKLGLQEKRFPQNMTPDKVAINTKTDKKVLSQEDMRQILLKTEQEEKRILTAEKQLEMQQKRLAEKVVLFEKQVQANRQEMQTETKKNTEIQSAKNMTEQNDKAQFLMQKEEMQIQRSHQNMDAAALQQAARLATLQMGGIIKAGIDKSIESRGMRDILQQGMSLNDRQVDRAALDAARNAPVPPIPPAPMQMAGVGKEAPPPAPVDIKAPPVRENNEMAREAMQRQPDVAGKIAEAGSAVPSRQPEEAQVQQSVDLVK